MLWSVKFPISHTGPCMKCEVYLEWFFQILKLQEKSLWGLQSWYVLVTVDWKTYLRNVRYWWKSSINHFPVCIDKIFNHICNCKQLDTHYFFWWDGKLHGDSYIVSSFVRHGDAETAQGKVNETLNNFLLN